MAAIQYAAITFAQHSYSSGGNPLYWALVGAIGAVFSYLVYFGFSLVAAYINRKPKKTENTSTKEQTNNVEIEMTEQTEKEQSNEIDSKFCKFCGEKIEEDAIFCSHCGKKVHSSGSQKTALLDFCKSMISKIWNWLCTPFSYIKRINFKNIKYNKWGKRIKKIVFSVFVLLCFWGIERIHHFYYLPYHYNSLYKEGMSNVEKANEIAMELYNEHHQNKAIDVLTNSAEKGNVESMVLLGRYYKGYDMEVGYENRWRSDSYRQEYYEKSSYWYLQAAKRGNAEAQGELGHNYKYGFGVQQDFDKAIYWTKQGADNGDAVAQWRMGNLYLSGLAYYKYNRYFDYEIYWYDERGKFKPKDNPYISLKEENVKYMENEPIQVFLFPDIKKAKYYWKLAANQGLKEAKGALEKIY